jgi:hypothetical protein
MQRRGLIAGPVALAVVAFLIFLPSCQRAVAHDAFAKCLSAKQVTLYGLYWCEHCAEQKKMFGSSFQYVSYVECGIKGSRAEEPACIQAGVKNFPTWKMPDGALVEGVRTLEFLSAKSGCSLQ